MHDPLSNARRATLLAAISALAVACGNSSPPVTSTQAAGIKTPAGEKSPTVGTRVPSASKARPIPEGDKPLSDVHELVPDGDCPDPGPSGAAVIAAAGSALIPLKVGLTLSSTWKGYSEDYEHECLLQVSMMDGRAITTTDSCPIGKNHEPLTTVRRLCWKDVIDSYLYVTQGAKEYPETLVGALSFNLSLAFPSKARPSSSPFDLTHCRRRVVSEYAAAKQHDRGLRPCE